MYEDNNSNSNSANTNPVNQNSANSAAAENGNVSNTNPEQNAGADNGSYRYTPPRGTQDAYIPNGTNPSQNNGNAYNGSGYTTPPYASQNGYSANGYNANYRANAKDVHYTDIPGGYTPQNAKKQKKGLTAGKIVAIALACSILGGCLGVGGTYLLTRSKSSDEETTSEANVSSEDENSTTMYIGDRNSSSVNTERVDTSTALTPSEVYAQNVNSTVGITTSITTNYWGYQTTSAASGSGFILTADGYILTNYHVIEDSNSIQVTTYDNTSYDATIVGYDESNDIAVLKIDATDLTPVVLGSSDDLNVGDEVMAIGNPLGELTFSLTVGYVSALDREVTLSSGTTMDLIQTDAAINSGNSGGALFNCYGEVVGITNAKYSSSSSSSSASIDNIGFAIPIDHVKSIVTSIIEKGYIVKPYIGVSVTSVSDDMQSYGLPAGAVVKSVTEGSPAEDAKLEVNDIITAINGEDISSSNDLVSIVSDCTPGDEITLSVYRQSESELLSITLTVGEQQQSAVSSSEEESTSDSQSQYNYSYPFGYGYGYGYGRN